MATHVPLYVPGPHPPAGAQAWNAEDFVAVDDRVRGGKSVSEAHVDKDKHELVFSGELDITALGGAGFASQADSQGFPQALYKDKYAGLRLAVRKPCKSASKASSDKPVRSFVLNLKTQVPPRRPDGRRESVVTWDWAFRLPGPADRVDEKEHGRLPDHETDQFWVFETKWDDLEPTYRGRPAENPGELRPEETKEWSIMARSNFGSQYGPFELQLHSLSAIAAQPDATYAHEKRSALYEAERSATLPLGEPAARRSGEYYGFALFIFATVLYAVWAVWGLTPDWALRKVGIAWYPNRCVDPASTATVSGQAADGWLLPDRSA